MTTRTRIFSVLAVAGPLAMAVLGLSGVPVQVRPGAGSVRLPPGPGDGPAARFLLIAVAVVALGAFAILPLIVWWQRRRWSAFADWRTWPPGYDPWADAGGPAPGRHEGSAYRPGYGFLPGHGLTAAPTRNTGGPGRHDPARLRYSGQGAAKVRKGA